MEYGLIPKINQYADNNEVLIQQVQPSSQTAELKNGDEARQIAKNNFLNEVGGSSSINETSKTSKTKEVTPQEVAQYKEVVLTNLNFGFNDSSKDFFVRAVRGETQNQFPTDDMMRLKAYFIAQARAETAAEINN